MSGVAAGRGGFFFNAVAADVDVAVEVDVAVDVVEVVDVVDVV